MLFMVVERSFVQLIGELPDSVTVVVSVGAGRLAVGMRAGRLSVAFMCHVVHLNSQLINRMLLGRAQIF